MGSPASSIAGGGGSAAGGGGGSGDVVGPASSTDNSIVRHDGTTGKLTQDSGIRITDSNLLQFEGTSSSFPGLKRSTTGLLVKTANDGTSSWISARRPFVVPGTATLTESQTRYMVTNSGAVAAQTFTLPGATLPSTGAVEYMIAVVEAQDIIIQAGGTDVIYHGVNPSSAGGTLTLTGVGTTCRITIAKAGIWVSLVNGTATPA